MGARQAGYQRIHDDEPDADAPVVRALLRTECPQWATAPIEYLATSGTDNAMWRIRLDDSPDLVVRLPRRPGAAAGVEHEVAILRRIEHAEVGALGSSVATPVVRHVGEPSEVFPHRWSVLEWIDGADAWTARAELDRVGPRLRAAFAEDLGRAVVAIGRIDATGLRPRSPGSRGGPLGPLLERLDRWLTDPEWNASALVDVAAVRRLADEAAELVAEPALFDEPDGPAPFEASGVCVHGDLIPGNLLVDGGRLSAVIDWGGAGCGDPAQDLAPAWAVLDAPERAVFRSVVGADDATWVRGRTFELEHAVGGVIYYVPKRHPLGDVMTRTLHRILTP